MATKQVIRELVTLWGFDIDKKPLQEVNAGINTIKQSLKTLAVSVAGSAAAVGFLLNEAGEDEQTRIAFETMLGSAEAMEQKLRELEAFAVKTPFTLKGIKQNSKLLLGMGIEAEKLVPTLKFLGDVSAGLSVPLERLALNFGQVRNQNKLTGRELRDFAVAGVPLLDELAKNLGKTTKEITGMVSAGDIGFAEVEKAFTTMTSGSGRFADLMIKQSKSFFGLLSNIQDILQLLARDLGNELLPEAKKITLALMEMFTANRALIFQNMAEFVRNLAAFMGTLFDITMSSFRAMTGLVKVFGGWNKVLSITFKLISTIIGLGLLLGIGLVTKAIGGMVLAWGANVVAMVANVATGIKLMGVQKGLAAGLALVGNTALIAQAKLMAIPLAIGAIAVAIALIAEDIFAFSEGRDSVFGRMINGIGNVVDMLKAKFGEFKDFIGNLFGSFIFGLFERLNLAITLVNKKIDDVLGKKTFFERLSDFGKSAASGVSDFFTKDLPNVSGQAALAGDTIGAGSSSAITGLGGAPFSKKEKDSNNVKIENKVELTLNVEGMDSDTAQDFVTERLGDELDIMLRGATRDGESPIER